MNMHESNAQQYEHNSVTMLHQSPIFQTCLLTYSWLVVKIKNLQRECLDHLQQNFLCERQSLSYYHSVSTINFSHCFDANWPKTFHWHKSSSQACHMLSTYSFLFSFQAMLLSNRPMTFKRWFPNRLLSLVWGVGSLDSMGTLCSWGSCLQCPLHQTTHCAKIAADVNSPICKS
jgi:hypothetical protein